MIGGLECPHALHHLGWLPCVIRAALYDVAQGRRARREGAYDCAVRDRMDDLAELVIAELLPSIRQPVISPSFSTKIGSRTKSFCSVKRTGGLLASVK
jgi:hypothetical protein